MGEIGKQAIRIIGDISLLFNNWNSSETFHRRVDLFAHLQKMEVNDNWIFEDEDEAE